MINVKYFKDYDELLDIAQCEKDEASIIYYEIRNTDVLMYNIIRMDTHCIRNEIYICINNKAYKAILEDDNVYYFMKNNLEDEYSEYLNTCIFEATKNEESSVILNIVDFDHNIKDIKINIVYNDDNTIACIKYL